MASLGAIVRAWVEIVGRYKNSQHLGQFKTSRPFKTIQAALMAMRFALVCLCVCVCVSCHRVGAGNPFIAGLLQFTRFATQRVRSSYSTILELGPQNHTIQSIPPYFQNGTVPGSSGQFSLSNEGFRIPIWRVSGSPNVKPRP